MNEYQRYAIENHCRFAWQCSLLDDARRWPRYGYAPSPLYSIILTVNSGYE